MRRLTGALVALIALSIPMSPVEAKRKCGWRYPGKCVSKVTKPLVIVATPSVLIDVVTNKPLGTTAGNVADESQRVSDNIHAETKRAGKNVNEAGLAIGHYIESELNSAVDSAGNAAKRVQEGKFVDAFWHLSTDPIKNTERAAAVAAQESSLLNTVAATAAAAYGGPGGSAAYAAWYAYRASGGDVELALRVGVLAGLTNAAGGAAGKMPSATVMEAAKKTLVAGAIGGVAVAAAGGDEQAVTQGFLMGGGMVLVQDAYKNIVGSELDPRGAKGDPYCMATVGAKCSPKLEAYILDDKGQIQYDKNGSPLVDVTKTDLRRPHVGTWAKAGESGLTTEAGVPMKVAAQIPGLNAMSVLHDHWSFSVDMGTITNVVSIAPAIVVTYIGTDGPLQGMVVDKATDDKNSR